MKKTLRYLIVLLVMSGFIFGTAILSQSGLTANNAGAPAVRTGSPGDSYSCTSCHSGTAQNVFGLISSNIPSSGYAPGTTYMITANVTDANKNRFGFEISPQNPTGTKLGVMTVTDAARTKLIGSGKYITHTSSGTSGAGSNSWSFNWTAPAAGTGDVTFYGAFNFTNHNNASSGDVIKLDQYTVHEDLFTSVSDIDGEEHIVIYPNPVVNTAQISIPSNVKINTIKIYDIDGSLVRTYETSQISERLEIDVTTLTSGTYYVSFAAEKGTYTDKLIKF
jgi:hypothetical protein